MINLFSTLLAACTDPIGCVTPPDYIKGGIDDTGKLTGIVGFMNSILNIVFIGAGLWAFFNIVIAGYGFMNAGGDPKKFTAAWDRIWQTLLGLTVIVLSFLIAAVAGIVFFGSPTAILQPTLEK